MNKQKSDEIKPVRMPCKRAIYNFCNKYFKYIAISIIVILLISMLGLTLKVVALQDNNATHISQKAQLAVSNNVLKKEKEVLQDNVVQLETEVQVGNDALVQYEKKIKDLESQKPNTQPEPQKPVVHNKSWGTKKTYMSYRAITNTGSRQYALQRQAVTDPNTGIRMVGDSYCIAIGSGWGHNVGDKLLVTMNNGQTFYAIMADAKADIHTQADNKTAHDGSVVEFVVNVPSLPQMVRTSGTFSSLEMFNSGISSITKR